MHEEGIGDIFWFFISEGVWVSKTHELQSKSKWDFDFFLILDKNTGKYFRKNNKVT